MRALAACIPLVVSSAAFADSFETAAQGAVAVAHPEDLVWAVTAPCDQGDDVQQRQCRITRDRKAKQLVGATLLIDGDADALAIGAWSAAKKSVAVTLSACIRCRPIDVDGKPWFVTGSGAPRSDGANKLKAAVLYDNARQFVDEAAATAWTKAMARARFQLLVRVPTENRRRFAVAGKDGLALDVLAWRVINPCDGSIVLASLPAKAVEPDRRLCAEAGGVVIPADATLEALTPAMVSEAMRPVVSAARACSARLKLTGKTKLEITILADGSIEKFEQRGDFDGTPLATCIADAMTRISFPKTKKPKTKIGFPVSLN